MRHGKSSDEDMCSKRGKSNYFQTEFSLSIIKKPEDVDSCVSVNNISQSVVESDDEYFTNKYDKRNVSISVQADDDIISHDDMPKERKRWIRPPLVGQASTSNDNEIVIPVREVDFDEEIIQSSQLEEHAVFVSTESYPNRKDYVTEKPPEGAVQAEGRVPSPASASSLASIRPLEWDNGADVGYSQYYPEEQDNLQMSSLERLALGQSASLLTRSDPEGTPCVVKQLPSKSPPDAMSTPLASVKNSKNSSDSEDRKQYPLFPEVLIEEHLTISDSEYDEKVIEDDSALKKSTSLENVNELNGPAAVPRSQSQNSVAADVNPRLKHLIVNKSNSSSSVATVVTKNKNVKSVQSQVDIKQPSDTDSVQTAANSFEYLPGDKYECSGNSDLKRDVERGVKLLQDFMKGTGANDTLSKRQLLKKVVDGILDKRYPDDEDWEAAAFGEGRCMTRRSQNRDDVSGQSTPADDQSRDSVLSRMGKSAAEGHSAPSSTFKSSSSASQHSSADQSIPRPEPILPVAHRRTSSLKDKARLDTKLKKQSSNESVKNDWKAPMTQSEKMYELERSKVETQNRLDPKLLKYLSSERENQLEWIKKEINHLSNLKLLLEKHETLKKNFARLKNVKERPRVKSSDSKLRVPYYKTRKDLGKSSSAPLRSRRPTIEQEFSDQSSWNSHGYDGKMNGGALRRHASTNTAVSVIDGVSSKLPSKPISYTIVFQNGCDVDNNQPQSISQESAQIWNRPEPKCFGTANSGPLIIDREKLKQESREKVKDHLINLKLQNQLMTKKPDYVVRAENRRQVVAELTALREIRQQNKEKIIAAAINNNNPQPPEIPPNPLVVKRVVSQKEMRNLTEKVYKKSLDVKQKQLEIKRKEEYQTNRLMADLFNRKLQRKVLHGQTDLSNSVNVISSF